MWIYVEVWKRTYSLQKCFKWLSITTLQNVWFNICMKTMWMRKHENKDWFSIWKVSIGHTTQLKMRLHQSRNSSLQIPFYPDLSNKTEPFNAWALFRHNIEDMNDFVWLFWVWGGLATTWIWQVGLINKV